jgi:perosamine synthetase
LIPHNQWTNRPEYEAAALRVLRSGHVGQGPEVAAFERELAARFRPDGEAVCVSSGTAALYLAITALGIREVDLSTYSCTASYYAAFAAETAPRDQSDGKVLDVDPATFSSAATIAEHVYGVPLPGEHAIEDFTHAPGGSVDGRPCGSLGDLSVISFGATKPLGIGAGAAILGPAYRILDIRDRRDYDAAGLPNPYGGSPRFNWQLSDIYAAIGRERLRLLDKENRRRAGIANTYCHAIPNAEINHQAPKGHHPDTRVWYRFVLRLHQVEEAQRRFSKAGIETIVPLRTDELLHRRLSLPPEQFPNAEEIARTTLSLPIWPGMTNDMVNRVADCLATLGDLD